jgi:hypothetical protein
MAAQLHITQARATDADGDNLSGAKWFFYLTTSLTPQSVYTTSALSVAHNHPVVADAGGKFPPIYFDSSITYRGILKTADEATVIDDIDPINTDTLSILAQDDGAQLIGFKQAGAGSRQRDAEGKMREIISLDDKTGVDPTAATSSLAALQALIDDAPSGGTVLIPNTYRITATAGTTALTITKPLTIRGMGQRIGNVPDGNNARGFLYFDTNVAVAFHVSNVAVIFENICISGIGYATSTGAGILCTGATGAVHLVGGSVVQSFQDGITVTDADYVKIERSVISYCKNTLVLDSCFNVNIVNSHLRPEGANSTGIIASNNSQINVFGGAIESYQLHGWRMTTGSRIALYGVYYEGEASGTSWNGFLGDNTAVYERACYVYMSTCARHISSEGTGTINYAIDSKFNEFVPDTTARRVDYYSFNPASAAIWVEVSGHRYVSTAAPGANNNWLNPDYLFLFNDFSQGVGHYAIDYPVGHADYGKGKNTLVDVIDPALAAIASPKTLSMAGFKAAAAGSDPIGIRTAYGPNAPYRAVYQNAQWEKVGYRITAPTAATTGIAVAAGATPTKAEFDALVAAYNALATQFNSVRTNSINNGVWI